MKLTKDQELALQVRYGNSDSVQLLINITNSTDIENTLKVIGDFIERKTQERLELLKQQQKGAQ